jgi:NitT/TauT family transport system ATP-binding protein
VSVAAGAPAPAASGTGWRVLRAAGVWKRFGRSDRGAWILQDVSLDFAAGSFTCIVGPSGSGKTTLLNLLAGFDTPTQGVIAFDDRPVAGAGRDRAVIFQDVANALFPWLTAVENVEFGLRVQRVPRGSARRRALEHLALVGLDQDGDKFPYQLSGGMKQRVQIARALANDPAVLLMDEPFAALDAITRRGLGEELVRIWGETRKTVVFVTHDLIEALLLGTRVVVLGADGTTRAALGVSLGGPRSPSHPELMRLYDQLQGILEAEVGRARRGPDVGRGQRAADPEPPGGRPS